MVTCRCGTVYDANEMYYCPVCSAPRNVAVPMQQVPAGPGSTPPTGPSAPQGGYFGGPPQPGPGAGLPAQSYPGFDERPLEKSKADVADGVGRLLQALAFVVLGVGVIAAVVIVVLALTSDAGKGALGVQFLTTLLTTAGFFGVLRVGALAADYIADQYRERG